MIEKIRITNFKCFQNLQLPLEDMTIFTGANAAGKSTIIQAILLNKAASLEKESSLDVTKALGVRIGNPQSLIAQNKTKIENADFILGISENADELNVLYSIDKLSPLKLNYKFEVNKWMQSQIFYLNAERMGPRISYPAGFDEKISSDGSNAAFLIDRADSQGRKVPGILSGDREDMKFSICIEEWMQTILGSVTVSVTTDIVKASTDVLYGNEYVETPVLPTMTGFGISYVLPIVTAGLWCASIKDAVLIIENPEAHLHPYAQSQMGKFLQLVSVAGIQVIVETHSEHIIDGARVQAAIMEKTANMQISYLSSEDEKICVKNIRVNEDGELSEWPKGFFDQKSQDLRQLFYVRQKHAGR